MKVKATVLVDNYAFGINGVLAQHGWAVFLETIRAITCWIRGQAKSSSITPMSWGLI